MDETFSFGRFRVSASRRELWADGAPVTIGARALDVLIALLRRPSELVTKTELIDAVWAGVAVEDNAIAAQVSAVRRALNDGQGGVRYVQTVPGRGYRFVAPVAPDPSPRASPAVRAWLRPHRVGALVALGLVVAMLAAGALLWRPEPPAPAPWSSQDPRMTFVIGPVSAPADPALAAYADQFARALAARFTPALGDARLQSPGPGATPARYGVALDVRRSAGAVITRVTLRTQRDGAVLAVREVSDPLGSAPSLPTVWRASALVKTTALQRDADIARTTPPRSQDARDLLLMAIAAPPDRVHNAEAIGQARRAFEMAPSQPIVIEALDALLDARAFNGWSADPGQDLVQVEALSRRLLVRDPENVMALQMLGDSYLLRGRWEDARICEGRLLALKPDDALGLVTEGQAALALGDFTMADSVVTQLAQFSNPKVDRDIAALAGRVRFHQGRWGEAAKQLRLAIQLTPGDDLRRPAFAGLRLYLAAAEARQGRLKEARAALADFRAAVPGVAGPAAFARWNDPIRLPLTDDASLETGLERVGWRNG